MLETDSIKRNPMFWYLVVLTISSTAGLQTWTTLFNNFAVDVAGLQGNHVGMIQSIREIPGFLALLAVYVMLVIREHRLSAISILILGAGLAATGFFPTFAGIAITTLISSLGFHYYETTNMSLTLQYFKKDESPWVFGKLTSLAAATSIGIGLLIWGMTAFLDFTQVYLVIGVLIAIAGLWGLLTRDPSDINIIPQRKQMVLRKKYWLFYFLTFMAGARRQIFIAFSVLLLVQKFQYTVQEVTILFIINNTINYFLSPLVGKSIIRFGERKVLSLEYLSVIFLFTAYATTDSKLLVAFIYILDQIFFTFAIAIRTYFQKVGDPQDIAPSMAMGFSINHLAAVFLPAIGGMLWVIDYRIPFFAGAAMGVVSLLAVQKIKTAHS
ncbi:MAG TPA: MFS transporter [Desulfobacterales bacterium]|nr:MFS transporter [Desulfobacterales bacterium]